MAVVPSSNGHMSLARKAALDLFKRGIMPIPLPYGRKHPSDRPNWQNERYTLDDLSVFDKEVNIGMRLGRITAADGAVLTNNFLDVDLDCPEAVRAARFFLPKTDMKWGRRSNPCSHYGYRLPSVDGARNVGNFNDPLNPKDANGKADARICEIRWNGQTVAPGSINRESGKPERVEWEPDGKGDPAVVDFDTLLGAVRKVYASALLARYWRDGIRHDAALPLAGMFCLGGMSEADALAMMDAICRIAGENESDIANRLGCVRDTYKKAVAGQPFTAGPTLEDFIDKSVVDAVKRKLELKRSTIMGDVAWDGIDMTDFGNAERFANAFEGRALYCDDQNQWYLYENGVWAPDRDNRLAPLIRGMIQQWRKNANDPTVTKLGNTNVDMWNRHAKSWSTAKGVRDMLWLARGFLPVLPEQFDADPWLLNVLNGTVELGQDGSHGLRVHRWQDLLTKQWHANYNPAAVSADLEAYFARFVPEQDRREFLEEALGYSLTGNPKRYNFQLIGPSNAGKSMFLRFIKEHSGAYGASLKYSALKPESHGGGDRPRSDLLSLRGARMLTIAEVDGGVVWDTTLFKTMLSGGDFYTVRGAYERRVQTFPFTVALWTSGNTAYGADSSDDAAYERVHVIRFEHPMPQGERDDNVGDHIIDPNNTGDAFLAMILRGYARLRGEKKGRLSPPDVVVRATQQMRLDLDPFKSIFEQSIEITLDPQDGVLKSELTNVAKMIFRRESRGKWNFGQQSKLEEALARRNIVEVRSSTRFNNARYYRGVRWNPELLEDLEAEYVGAYSKTLTQPDWLQESTEP